MLKMLVHGAIPFASHKANFIYAVQKAKNDDF